LEDTDVTFEQLEQKFGHIAELVAEESENKRENQLPEQTWKIRKQETIEHFQNRATKEAKMIALGDKLSNIRAIYKDYQTLGDSLWERFNQKDKSEQGRYYKAMRDVLSELKDYPAWQEYSKLVDRVFGANEI
jgi:myo-inositol-1(or 4)-monophosphatase